MEFDTRYSSCAGGNLKIPLMIHPIFLDYKKWLWKGLDVKVFINSHYSSFFGFCWMIKNRLMAV